MNITVLVNIKATPAQVWSVFKDLTAWERWYGVPMDDARWAPGGYLHYPEHDGIIAGNISIGDYTENELCVFTEHWTTTVHSVQAQGEETIFTKTIIPQNGANYTVDGYPKEVAKQQAYLDQFKAIVEERFAPAEAPAEEEATAEETAAPAAPVETTPAPEKALAPETRDVFCVFAAQGPAFGQVEGDVVAEKANTMREDFAPAKDMEFELVRPHQWGGKVEFQNIGGMIQTSIRLDSFKDAITRYLKNKGVPREVIEKGIAESDANSLLLTNPFSGVTVIGIPLRGLPKEEPAASAPAAAPAAPPAVFPPQAAPAAAQPGMAPQPKKKSRKKLIILLIVAAVVIIGAIPTGINLYQNQRYQKALQYYSEGDYTGAASVFRSLGNYSNAAKYAEESENFAKFEQAQTLMNWGRYDEALEIFQGLGNFNGAKALAEECANEANYQKAEALMEEKKYAEAAELYERLGKDDLAQDAWCAEYYRQGVEYYEAGDWELARQSFEKATEHGTYKDSEDYLNRIEAVGLAEWVKAMLGEEDYEGALGALEEHANLQPYIAEYDALMQQAREGAEEQLAAEREEQIQQDLAKAKEYFSQGLYYSAYKLYTAHPGYADADEMAEKCVQPKPSTGETYHNGAYISSSTDLTISPPDDGTSTYFKIYLADDEDVLVCSVFISAGDDYTVSLPGGSYIFKSAYSEGDWWGEKEMFGDGSGAHYQRLRNGSTDVFELEYNNAYTLTLRSATNGNVGNRSEDPDDF